MRYQFSLLRLTCLGGMVSYHVVKARKQRRKVYIQVTDRGTTCVVFSDLRTDWGGIFFFCDRFYVQQYRE